VTDSDVSSCEYDVTSRLPWQRDAVIPTVVECERVTDDDVCVSAAAAAAGARQHDDDDDTITRYHNVIKPQRTLQQHSHSLLTAQLFTSSTVNSLQLSELCSGGHVLYQLKKRPGSFADFSHKRKMID